MDKTAYRTQTVLISFGYLFLPLLLTPLQDFSSATARHTFTSEDQQELRDVGRLMDEVLGKGGPEKPQSAYLDLAFDEGVEEDKVSVVETKTINYMKVANTQFPVDDPIVSSDYGWRSAPCKGCSSNHVGIDFVPGRGKPIYAVADGMVVEMGQGGGYGDYVILTHLVPNAEGVIEEWTTVYAHMLSDSFAENLRIGATVKSGEQLGRVGSTGMSTGPHLHFELLINGENVDPMPLLGNYEVVVVTEEQHEDWMFLGDTFTTVEKVVTYE